MTPIDNQLLILMPVFNDWDSVTSLLDEIDGVLSQEALAAEVLVVDDGSLAAAPGALRSKQLRWITKVDILQLRRNVGHQRAIWPCSPRSPCAPVHQSRDSRLGNIHNGVLLLLLNQMAMMSFLLVFVVLSSRAGSTFIPARDYKLFVKRVITNGE